MRKTALRSMEMHTKYLTYPKDPNFMKNAPSLVDYHYWRIIDNKFPWDNVVKPRKHHMLVPRRKFATLGQITAKEQRELNFIIDTYLQDYDNVSLNTDKGRSIKDWLHYHLVVWRLDIKRGK